VPGLDRDQFELLVPELAPVLLRFARSIVHDEATAEDLVQETFLRAWRARDRFRGESTALTWMRRILHHAAVDRFRRLAHEDLVDAAEASWRDDAYTVDGDAVVERALDRDALLDALVHLPFTYRSAVLLHDVEGWTAAEVAEVADIGLPLAKQRIRRGRMALVTQLAGGDERRAALDGVVLRCWNARSLVSEYLDGELEADQRAAVEAHLSTCPTCPPLYAALVGTQASLTGLRDPDSVVPPAVIARLRTRIDAES
jgi:RNA polymerase sigma-70 factor (ECF subfamily)